MLALVSAADGTIVAQYEYGPFHELIRASGPLAFVNPFRAATKFQDDESGYIYYGYRYYDPIPGRWLGREPLGEFGAENLYSFVRNNPNFYFDTDGRQVAAPAAIALTTETASSGGAGVTLTLTAGASGPGLAVVVGVVAASVAAIGFVTADIYQGAQIMSLNRGTREAQADIALQTQLLAELQEEKDPSKNPHIVVQPEARRLVAEKRDPKTCCRFIWDAYKRGHNAAHDRYTARIFRPDYELIVIAPDRDGAVYDSGSQFPEPVVAAFEAKTGRDWASRLPRDRWIPVMHRIWNRDMVQFIRQERVAKKCNSIWFNDNLGRLGYLKHAPQFAPYYRHVP